MTDISTPPANLTANQAKVLGALQAAAKPCTAYELLDTLRPDGIKAPPQVYRALQRLQDLGLIHRIESLNAFLACDRGPHEHATGFAICTRCGKTLEFSLRDCSGHLTAASDAHGFMIDTVHVEMTGLCAGCRG